MEVEVEFISDPVEGIVITDAQEGYFLPVDKFTVEEWAMDNGEEDVDYTEEKEWDDDLGWQSQKYLIADAWLDQIRDYAFAHRGEWVQEQEA